MLSRLNAWASRRPLLAAVLVGSGKSSACDLAVQCGSSDSIDWRRNAVFATFGALWVGAVQYGLFNVAFPAMLPGLNRGAATPVTAAVFLDNFVHIPLGYLPTFYVIREVANQRDMAVSDAAEHGLKCWRANLVQDAVAQLAIFCPVQALNFRFSPPHLRVPTVVAAGVVWITGLSFFRGETGS